MTRRQIEAIQKFQAEFSGGQEDMMLDTDADIYVARFRFEALGTDGLVDLTCIDQVDGRYQRVQVGPRGRIFR